MPAGWKAPALGAAREECHRGYCRAQHGESKYVLNDEHGRCDRGEHT
jgi:hypothetical protein